MDTGRMGQFHLLALVATAISTASAANWSSLDAYQETITRADFDRLLATIYCPSGALTNYLTYSINSVTLHSTPAKTNTLFSLHFSEISNPKSQITYRFRRIALDPGHIGGKYARLEERFFQRGRDRPVQEASLNLTVARLLKQQLQADGFTVLLTKNKLQPVTDKRPADFPNPIQFYRQAEITARAELINTKLKPDLTLCLHFNAIEWNEHKDLVDDNRLLLYIHGNYLPVEIADDEQKFRLLTKLLSRSSEKELPIAEVLATALVKATGLPPLPPSDNAIRVSDNPYILARNLAANRLYDGPVVYLEPYYMNNKLVYQRIQLGDFAGQKQIAGHKYKSIFREYADAVAEALTALHTGAPSTTGAGHSPTTFTNTRLRHSPSNSP